MLTKNDLDYFTNRANRLTPVEAAQYLERTPKTLAQWRYKKNGPPFIKVRQQVFYDRQLLDEWLKRQTQVIWTLDGIN